MKKFFLLCFCLLVACGSAFAQSDSIMKAAIVKGEEKKSMNRQQILTTGFQALGKNLTSDDKGLELRTSFFSLLFQDSLKKFRSNNYLKHSALRNINFIIGGGIDKSSKINAFSVGLSYNLLNLRDPSEVSLDNKLKGDKDYQARSRKLEAALAKVSNNYKDQQIKFLEGKLTAFAKASTKLKDTAGLWEKVTKLLPDGLVDKIWKDPKILVMYKAFADAVGSHSIDRAFDITKYLDKDQETVFFKFAGFLTSNFFADQMGEAIRTFSVEASKPKGNLKNTNKNLRDADYNAFISELNKEIADPQLNIKTAAEVYRKQQEDYDEQIRKIIQRPLLTLGYVYKYNSFGVFHQHIPSLAFLQGLSGGAKKPWELTLTLSDTIGTNLKDNRGGLGRQVGNIELGLNKVLFKGSDDVSLLEMKLSAEENLVLLGRFTDEKKDQFFCGLTFQGRFSSKSPWLKFAMKYNKDAKFLGFLDITLNLEKAK